MKKMFLLSIILMMASMMSNAHPECKFDPHRYHSALRQYIITEARLTQKEAVMFFPLYDEMRKKQRTIYHKLSTYRKQKPNTEKGCRDAIHAHDRNEIEMKKIQQAYHNKFLKVISASKLYDVIRAEEMFNRNAFKKMSGR